MEAIIGLVTVLFLAIFILFYEARVRAGLTVERRRLVALEHIERGLSRAAETGRPLHLSPGMGPLGGPDSAPETFAGLLLAQRISDLAARSGGSVATSSGDAATHLAIRGLVRQAYRDAGYAEEYRPGALRLYAHQDGLALQAGLGTRYSEEPFEASITVGAFGPHFLLSGAQGAAERLPQIAGTSDPQSLAAMVLTTNGTLIGEEIYAAESYIAPTSFGLSRLLTHDLLRMLVIAALIVGLVFQLMRIAGISVPVLL